MSQFWLRLLPSSEGIYFFKGELGMKLKRLIAVFLLVLSVILFLVFKNISTKEEILVATTTSLQDSGLLEEIVKLFENEYQYKVKIIAVGTGQALELGKRGDVDIVITHDPENEKKLVEEGFFVNYTPFVYNYFVLLGPTEDPANVSSSKTIVEAFQKIAQNNSLFVSRGDNSGTHKKELKIWNEAGIDPTKEDWYIESGSGMGQTLLIANEKLAYTLSDNGTFLAFKDKLQLEILFKDDERLLNVYHIMLVNPERFKNLKINYVGAKKLLEFLTSQKVQRIIKAYGVQEFGEPLFYVLD